MASKKTKPELQALLKEKGLPTTGNKNKLMQRLLDHISNAENTQNVGRVSNSRNSFGSNGEIMHAADEVPNHISDADDEHNHISNSGNIHNHISERVDIAMNRNVFENMAIEREMLRREHALMQRERRLLDIERSMMQSTQAASSPNVTSSRGKHFTVREIVDTLPEFDPIGKNNSATQFISRIRDLNSVYDWDDRLLLFAAQSKLRGYAKSWNDGHATVFKNFDEFALNLIDDFPSMTNEADVHLEMINSPRTRGEGVDEYFYRMCALGRGGGLSDASIIKYIRSGVNYEALQNSIAGLDLRNLNDLLAAMRRYIQNSVSTSARGTPLTTAKPQQQQLPVTTHTIEIAQPKQQTFSDVLPKAFSTKHAYGTTQPSHLTFSNALPKSSTPNRTNMNATTVHAPARPQPGPICFNCRERGHLSVTCPLPQRRLRCDRCKRIGHRTEDCVDRNQTMQRDIMQITEKATPTNMHKDILVNNMRVTAFIDSGSSRSLIKRSIAVTVDVLKPTTPLKLNGFGGGNFVCSELLQTVIRIDDEQFVAELCVVDDELLSCEVLLGTDILGNNGTRLIIEEGVCRIESNDRHINESLNDAQRSNLNVLLGKYRSCFAENVTELGKCCNAEMTIQLTSDKPVSRRPYRIAFAKRPVVTKIIKELLANDIIRPSTSPYASPIVLAKKQSGEDRLCIDFRELNAITVKQQFPMPVIDELLASLSGARYFCTLDMMSGYYQIPVAGDSQKFTAFVTHDGHYEFTCMPFGLVNAPAVFQTEMNRLQAMFPVGEVICYLDDIIVPSADVEQGMARLERFLVLLHKTGFKLRMSKCRFLETEIHFLGHRISENGISPGKNKVAAIENFAVPENIHDVRRFLGLSGFFRKFVPDYSAISRPLTKLLCKSSEFMWRDEQQHAFTSLKQKLCTSPVLCLYNHERPHELHTDASSRGLAGILMQEEGPGILKPVFYFSRHCSEAESKYHSHELEVLAIVESLERFRIYLLGKFFRIITDCSAVTTTRLSKPLLPRIARWWLKMQEYDFELIHRAGERIPHVDAMSRAPHDPPSNVPSVVDRIMRIDICDEDWLLTMQQQDAKLIEIIKFLQSKSGSQGSQIGDDYALKNNRLYRKVGGQLKWVVPDAVRWRVVKNAHDDRGHFGLDKTLEQIVPHYWFRRMRNFVRSYLAACIECCYNKRPGGQTEGRLHVSPMVPVPFRVLHIDHLGPFPKSSKGNTHIIGIADAFSKYVMVKAVKSTKTLPVIEMLNEVTMYFGLPLKIVSDRGTAFTSHLFQKFCADNDIQHIQNAVRTPRANGQIERANQLILMYLRTTIEDKRKWDTSLRRFQFLINSQTNSTTNCCPNDIVFNYKPRDMLHNRLLATLIETNDGKAELNQTNLEEVAKRIDDQRTKWKKRYDDSHGQPKKYDIGDLIVIENIPSATGESRKLEPKYRGPYVVNKVLDNDRYLIGDLEDCQRNQRSFKSVFTSEKLKPWCALGPEMDDDPTDDENENRDDFPVGLAELSHIDGVDKVTTGRATLLNV